MAGKSILFVDDNETIQGVLTQILQLENFQVTSAYSGQQALELLSRDQHFDLILLDLGLPDCNGAELAERISREVPNSAPILLVSGNPEVEDIHLEGRVVGTVTKPYDFASFIPLLRRSIATN